MRILIVGAGPTGLTAAVELARLGVIPTLIEKKKSASNLSRAVGILPASMDILAASGVAAAIDAEAVRFSGIIFHQGARPRARFALNFDDASRIWGLAQDRTEAHLAKAFQDLGGEVRYNCPLETLTQNDAGLHTVIGGREERFDLVIGADGVHSAVRRNLGLGYEGYDLPGEWAIADVRAKAWPDPTWFQGFLLPKGDVAVVVPLEADRFRVISSRADALAALPVPMEVTGLLRSAAFTIMVRQVTRYSVGRVFLAGDAAHCHSPVGGRGMNLGIADAAELAARIIAGETDGYHASRHREGKRVLEVSERGRRLVQSPSPIGRAALIGAMMAASHIPPLGRMAMHRFLGG